MSQLQLYLPQDDHLPEILLKVRHYNWLIFSYDMRTFWDFLFTWSCLTANGNQGQTNNAVMQIDAAYHMTHRLTHPVKALCQKHFLTTTKKSKSILATMQHLYVLGGFFYCRPTQWNRCLGGKKWAEDNLGPLWWKLQQSQGYLIAKITPITLIELFKSF